MHLNPYGEYAVLFAVDLCWNPPATGAELQTRCEAAGLAVDLAGSDDDVTDLADFLVRLVGGGRRIHRPGAGR